MRPMLDDIELPQVQEISTIEHRMLAEQRPPGMDGTLLQNLGRRPARLALWGIASEDDAPAFIEKLDARFRDGKPVTFTADIVADAKIDRMLVEDLRVQDLAGKPGRYAYILTLREYIEPVEPAATSGLDADILNDALNQVQQLAADLQAGLALMEQLSAFIPRLTALSRALEQQAPR